MLTWSLFCKETLPDRTFTFWEWFYRILLLTSHHMGRLWKEGYIMGFIMKQAAENMLLQQQNGCFLLRFSDSELGGVTIAYVRKPDFRKYICNACTLSFGRAKRFSWSQYTLYLILE